MDCGVLSSYQTGSYFQMNKRRLNRLSISRIRFSGHSLFTMLIWMINPISVLFELMIIALIPSFRVFMNSKEAAYIIVPLLGGSIILVPIIYHCLNIVTGTSKFPLKITPITIKKGKRVDVFKS